jgi:hypothetical protein
MKGCSALNGVSPVTRPSIALDKLISTGFDSSPWVWVRFPICAEKFLNPRFENWQSGDICQNASGFEWKSLWSSTLRGQEVKKEQNHCNTVKGINCGVCETEYRSSSMETSSQEGIVYWHPKTGYFLVITLKSCVTIYASAKSGNTNHNAQRPWSSKA